MIFKQIFIKSGSLGIHIVSSSLIAFFLNKFKIDNISLKKEYANENLKESTYIHFSERKIYVS